MTLFASVLAVHITRYHQLQHSVTLLKMASQHEIREEHVRPFQVSDSGSRRAEIAFSVLACLFALLAFPAQICLTVIDKHADSSWHRRLLSLALVGTGSSAICTGVSLWLSVPLIPSSKDRRDDMIYGYRYRNFILPSLPQLLSSLGISSRYLSSEFPAYSSEQPYHQYHVASSRGHHRYHLHRFSIEGLLPYKWCSGVDNVPAVHVLYLDAGRSDHYVSHQPESFSLLKTASTPFLLPLLLICFFACSFAEDLR